MKDYHEIDRLIVTEVMRCEEMPSVDFSNLDTSKKYYCINNTPDEEMSILEYIDGEWIQYLFQPSENMQDAMKAAEELGYTEIKIQDFGKFGKKVCIDGKFAYAETVSLALCLALLNAIEMKQSVSGYEENHNKLKKR